MTTTVTEKPAMDVAEFLQGELNRDFTGKSERGVKGASATVAESAIESPARLPRRIPGGFRSVGDELDRRARDWRNTVRLLDQQRPQLEMAEAERDRFYEALSRVVPEVQESGRALKALLDSTKGGDISGDISMNFTKSLNALEELESISEALTNNLLWVRSTWEQYARTIIRAQKMREEMRQGGSER